MRLGHIARVCISESFYDEQCFNTSLTMASCDWVALFFMRVAVLVF